MKRISSNTLAVLALGAGVVSCTAEKTDNQMPNIIVIMSDDAGYSDVGCFGSEINTPNIDKLGYEGIRFSRFYSGAKCEPSRSALFTGLYQGGDRAVNFVQILRDQGYYAIHSGKEHFMNWVPERAYAASVNDRSLTFWATTEYFEPPSGEFQRPFILNGEEVVIDQIYHEKKPFHKEDAATDNALRWLDEPVSRDQPFFLFLGYHAPHYPLQARPEDIAKYRGSYLKGWDQIRVERFLRLKEMGLISEDVVLSPPSSNVNEFRGHPGGDEERRAKIPLYRPWDDLTDEEKDELDLEMAVYAAMIDNMDQNIGRVLQKLEDEGQLDNTIIIYLTDNGACPYDSNSDFDYPPGHPDGYRCQSAAWSNASNTPFRYFKQYGHEGGALVHALMWWPSKIQAGSISHKPAHIVDLFPTILEAIGIEYPENINGHQPQKLQGSSLMPVLRGQEREDPEFIISGWTERFRMFRENDWKIVRKNDEEWELYNLEDDPTEIFDVAGENAGLVNEMENNYKDVQRRLEVESE
ncbi:MAG: arylsulfatase [Bacteroidales bacterium]